jgi:hypothetical protein
MANKFMKECSSQVPVAHACNPSYSGGRDQEDQGSKPNPGKQFMTPYLEKNLHKKRAGGVAQDVGSEFKLQYYKKKKKKIPEFNSFC